MKKDELLDLLNEFKPDDKYIDEVLKSDFEDVSKAPATRSRLTPIKILAPAAACLAVAVGARIAVSLSGRPFENLGGVNASSTVNSAESERDTVISRIEDRRSELEAAVNSAESKFQAAENKLEAAENEFETAENELETARSELETAKASEIEAVISKLEAAVNSAEIKRNEAEINLDTAKSELEIAKSELEAVMNELNTAEYSGDVINSDEVINSCKQALSEKYGVPLDELKKAPCDMKMLDLDGDGTDEAVLGFNNIPKLKGMYVFKSNWDTPQAEFVTELDHEGQRGYAEELRDLSVNILKYEDANESFYYYHTLKVMHSQLNPGYTSYAERAVYKIVTGDDGAVAAEEFLCEGCKLVGRELEDFYRVNGVEVTFDEYSSILEKYKFVKDVPAYSCETSQWEVLSESGTWVPYGD